MNHLSLLLFKILELDYKSLGYLLADFSIIAIPIVVTIFVLAVTLLGRAAKLTKEKQSEAMQKSKKEFDENIILLKEQIEKNPGDIESLKVKISDLEVKKHFTEESLIDIGKTYNSLTFEGGVLSPGKWFLLTLIIEKWIVGLYTWNPIINLIYFLLALRAMYLGMQGVIFTLKSIQTIALETQDEQLKQIENAIIEGMKRVESEKEPRPFIVFTEKPPFIFQPNTNVEIEFYIDLKVPGNKEARNVEAWFLFSKEIKIIENSKYSKPYAQSETSSFPLACTTIYKFDLVRKHTATKGKLKIQTPEPGEYKMKYKVECDSHSEPTGNDREITIIVKEEA